MEVVYYDPKSAGSYSGVKALGKYSGSSLGSVKQWLSSQDAYTLHKPVRKIFPRRKTFAKGINDLFQADLADLVTLTRYNDGHRFILTIVDVLSKFAFAIALKDKRGSSVAAAFERVFSNRLPTMIQTDRGMEFLNSEVQSVFRKYKIHHYSSLNDDIKAACVERFNRTLKSRLFRYMTHKHTHRWIDVLDDIVLSYNRSFHRSIGMAPIDVTPQNEDEIRRRLYPIKPKPKWTLRIDDTVRISKYKHVFEKGYLPNWTDEIFTISVCYPTHPVTYGLKDLAGEDIKGRFYKEELQKVNKTDNIYDVEKVIKTRKRTGKTEYFVKWKGYPEKFNSWTFDVIKR